MTMGELVQLYPSAGLTLFARYGVGSRDKPGFRPEQKLRWLLARYLVFDVDKVLETIRQADRLQSQLNLEPAEVRARHHEVRLVDARGRDEFELCALPGAMFLDADAAKALQASPDRTTVFYCREGPFAGAAAQHFRSRGVQAHSLRGGLTAWGSEVDPHFPLYGPMSGHDPPGRLRILPHRRRARLRSPLAPLPPGRRLLACSFPGASLWRQHGFLFVERDKPTHWVRFTQDYFDWIGQGGLEETEWIEEAVPPLEGQVREVLERSVQAQLIDHKGNVELVEVRDEVAYLRLSGGCQGCSGSGHTVNEEIAATLLAAIPQLVGVEDATSHEEGRSPQY